MKPDTGPTGHRPRWTGGILTLTGGVEVSLGRPGRVLALHPPAVTGVHMAITGRGGPFPGWGLTPLVDGLLMVLGKNPARPICSTGPG